MPFLSRRGARFLTFATFLFSVSVFADYCGGIFKLDGSTAQFGFYETKTKTIYLMAM